MLCNYYFLFFFCFSLFISCETTSNLILLFDLYAICPDITRTEKNKKCDNTPRALITVMLDIRIYDAILRLHEHTRAHSFHHISICVNKLVRNKRQLRFKMRSVWVLFGGMYAILTNRTQNKVTDCINAPQYIYVYLMFFPNGLFK